MAIDIARIRALCFDLDGTLSDTDDLFVQRLSRWLNPIRGLFPQRDPLPFARRLVMATEGPGTIMHGIPDRLGLDDELAKLGDWIYRIGIGHSSKPFLIIPGIIEMLDKLMIHYPMAIVSARGERSAMVFVNQFNLLPYFSCIATAQTCEHTKPYPDPILWAAEKMGVPAQACLMIGDTSVDIRAGKAAGAQAIGVLCGFGEEQELRQAGADYVIPSTSLLTRLLGK